MQFLELLYEYLVYLYHDSEAILRCIMLVKLTNVDLVVMHHHGEEGRSVDL